MLRRSRSLCTHPKRISLSLSLSLSHTHTHTHTHKNTHRFQFWKKIMAVLDKIFSKPQKERSTLLHLWFLSCIKIRLLFWWNMIPPDPLLLCCNTSRTLIIWPGIVVCSIYSLDCQRFQGVHWFFQFIPVRFSNQQLWVGSSNRHRELSVSQAQDANTCSLHVSMFFITL
jgi:hypothetical protein